jgi:hypothetical protein
MEEFRIGETGFATFRRQQRRIRITATVVTFATVAGVSAYTSQGIDLWATLTGLAIAALIIGFGYARGLRRQKKIFQSYRVTLSDEGITREVDNTPNISISFMEIREIIRTKRGHYIIKGLDSKDVISVPYWIEDHAGFSRRIEAFAPITVGKKDPFMLRFRLPLVLLFLAALVTATFSNDRVLVGVSVLLAIAGVASYLYWVHTSKNINAPAKRRSWLYLLVLIAIIYSAYTRVLITI